MSIPSIIQLTRVNSNFKKLVDETISIIISPALFQDHL